MSKRVPLQQRNTVNTQITTTVRIRQRLETIARRERVAVAEIGRRALTAYLEKGGTRTEAQRA